MTKMMFPFRVALSEAIEDSGKSRYQIVCEINERTGRDMSKHMLDKYTSSNPDYSFPSELLPLFCKITGSDKPFRVLLAEVGCSMHTPADRDLVKIARLEEESRRIEAKVKNLRIKCGLK